MVRFRRNFHPVNSRKNIVETSGILGAGTVSLLDTITRTVEDASLANQDEVEPGCTISSIYLSLYFISEGGEIASEVPLVDWYICMDKANVMGTIGFTANGLPSPGSTGTHKNKYKIFHTEKALAGGGDISLAGVPMVFKGVLKIPKMWRTHHIDDQIKIVGRSNFATKFCLQAIYKWYK